MKDSKTLGLAYVVKGDGSRGGRGWDRKRIKPQSSASTWSSILVAKWTKRSPQSTGMAMAPAPTLPNHWLEAVPGEREPWYSHGGVQRGGDQPWRSTLLPIATIKDCDCFLTNNEHCLSIYYKPGTM